MSRYGNQNPQKTSSYGTPKPSGKKSASHCDRNKKQDSDSEDGVYRSPPSKSYGYGRREDYGKPINTYQTPKKVAYDKMQTPVKSTYEKTSGTMSTAIGGSSGYNARLTNGYPG